MAHSAPNYPEPEEMQERPPLRILQDAFNDDEPLEDPRDMYIIHILRSLPPELIQSLSPSQYNLLKHSLYRAHRRHLVDIRGVIPFFFARYYFVFLFGRDRRSYNRDVPLERRKSSRWAEVWGWVLMVGILGLLVLGALSVSRLFR